MHLEGFDIAASSICGRTKLPYAILAASEPVPWEPPIVPVYLRASRHEDFAEFRVCRCETFDRSKQAVDSIKLDHTHAVRMSVPPVVRRRSGFLCRQGLEGTCRHEDLRLRSGCNPSRRESRQSVNG